MSRRSYDDHEWHALISQNEINPHKLQEIVMNFLVVQGYAEVGAEFAAETGLPLESVEGSVRRRVQIKQWVEKGEIQLAIDGVKNMHPNFVTEFPDLHFELLNQLLVEMIRENKVEEALSFAHSQLGPLAKGNKSYLPKIERTMSLLVFGTSVNRWNDLLELRERARLGDKLNQLLLTMEGLPKDSILSTLLKRLLWLQEQAKTEKIGLPQVCALNTAILHPDAS